MGLYQKHIPADSRQLGVNGTGAPCDEVIDALGEWPIQCGKLNDDRAVQPHQLKAEPGLIEASGLNDGDPGCRCHQPDGRAATSLLSDCACKVSGHAFVGAAPHDATDISERQSSRSKATSHLSQAGNFSANWISGGNVPLVAAQELTSRGCQLLDRFPQLL